ncbi:uncharacterized protein LOC115747281 [Rhodamnia argentea]|uniref:Uncharacterized protein LOC115747281 n=1 Tax=Rhodamnia argentea TaxID=178133 RepID=A0A8B8PY81_9MYRT|nr:uncharacterized protein LOC115747281 [Rhodamnia argentea]
MVRSRSYGDHMQLLGPLSLLVITCFLLDLFKRFSHLLIGLSVSQCASLLKLLSSGSDGEDGISAIQCSRRVFTAVALVLIARLGLKALPFGLSSKEIVRFLCEFKRKASELGDSDEVSRNRSPKSNESATGKALVRGIAGKAKELVEEDDEGEEDRECSCPEDEAFDVLALRKMVKIERRRAIAASMELEKERIAAASAADEAMSLILRLQSEKSSVELRANQDRRLAEQKQQYDWEVIESLRWMAASHEERRRALEGRLRSCRRRLRMRAGGDGGSSGVEGESCCFGGGSEESVGDAAPRNGDGDEEVEEEEEEEEETRSIDDVLISSLELDSLIEE